MLEKKVKLVKVGELQPYYKRENNSIVYDVTGQPVIKGHRRMILFESTGLRKDTFLITLFHDEAREFDLPIGTSGLLQFSCEIRELNNGSQDGENSWVNEIRLINFLPNE